jgi:hypothetical protein
MIDLRFMSGGRWIVAPVSGSQVLFHPGYRIRNGIRIMTVLGLQIASTDELYDHLAVLRA